jgi:hypothetical protein
MKRKGTELIAKTFAAKLRKSAKRRVNQFAQDQL